ncbi:hypothetical protein HYT55_01715 [Candidatus Woesearchaeota archaeon]|nr:hypothetical protein [Candidatus Woesearchaeota archaeon]
MTEQVGNLEGRVLGSIRDLEKIFPKWTRVTTSEGYGDSRPLYILGKDGWFFSWQDIIGYDCKPCNGIVLGKPRVTRRCIYPSRGAYYCKKCNGEIYRWDDTDKDNIEGYS